MKTILVGTDFSEGSERALEKACQLARAFNSSVQIIHVLEPVDDPDSDDPETQLFYQKLKSVSEEKMDAALARYPDLTIGGFNRIGPRHPTILEVAVELKADLIVLGSRPISAQEQRIGTSHRVAVTAPIPVLLVP